MIDNPRLHPAWTDAVAARNRRLSVLLAAALLSGACGSSPQNDEVNPGGKGINGTFAAAQNPACARADLVSLQEGPTVGSIVNVDVVVTDCDASMLLNGLNFEITFDDAVVDFLGCANGTLFASGQLVPGTPACSASGGDIVGAIAIQLPGSTQVSGGQATAVRLTFSVNQKGTASPAAFVGTDSQGGTTLFFANQATQALTLHVLGAGGYAGGNFVTN